jgi:hypothetical protein
MSITAKKPASIEALIIDSDVPLEQRKRALMNLIVDDSEASQKALMSLLEKAAQANGETLYARKIQELSELKKAMESGPLRVGTFIRMLNAAPPNGRGKRPRPRTAARDRAGCPRRCRTSER